MAMAGRVGRRIMGGWTKVVGNAGAGLTTRSTAQTANLCLPSPAPLAWPLSQLGGVGMGFPAGEKHLQHDQFWPWSVRGWRGPHLCSLRNENEDDDTDERGVRSPPHLEMSVDEAKKIFMHVNAMSLRKRLQQDPRESVSYKELLEICREAAVGSTECEIAQFASSLDESGAVLIFRDNVYLHPERIARLVGDALPFAIIPHNDPRRKEFEKLNKQKEEIDRIAHRRVRRTLWSGLLALTCQAGLFFRLTFWELSWDVMEPVAFFVTTGGLIAGYSYFLVTSRDPTYQDFLKRLYLAKQRKLYKRMQFDIQRYKLLERQCKCYQSEDDHRQ